MWGCKSLWILFIALLYLKDVQALEVWSEGPASDWSNVAAQARLTPVQGTVSFPDRGQISTARKDEGKTSSGIQSSGKPSQLLSVQLKPGRIIYPSYQQRPQQLASVFQIRPTDKPLPQPQSSGGVFAASSPQSGKGVQYPSPSQYPVTRVGQSVRYPQTQTRFDTQFDQGISRRLGAAQDSGSRLALSTEWISIFPRGLSPMQSFGPYSGTENRTSTGSGLHQGLASQYSGQSSPASQYSGQSSPASQYSGQSSPASQYSGQSSPALVINQTPESAMPDGSTLSSSRGSPFQSSTWYSLPANQYSGDQVNTASALNSQGPARQYGKFQTPQGINELGSSTVLTAAQQATKDSSFSSASISPQRPTSYWPLQRPSSLYVGSQTQQGTSWKSFMPGLTVTQQVLAGSTSSTSSSSSASPVRSSTWSLLSQPASRYTGSQLNIASPISSQGLASQYGKFQTQQGASQLGSSPPLTATQQATKGATTAHGSSSLSYFGSQSPTINGWSQKPSGQHVGSQTWNPPEHSDPPTSGTSSSSNSGSQSTSSYWLSKGFKFNTLPRFPGSKSPIGSIFS